MVQISPCFFFPFKYFCPFPSFRTALKNSRKALPHRSLSMSLQFSSRRVCSTSHLLSITRVTYTIISRKFYPQKQLSLLLQKKTSGSWLPFKESILVAKLNLFLELTLISSHLHQSYPQMKMLKLKKTTQKKKNKLNKQYLPQLQFLRVSPK